MILAIRRVRVSAVFALSTASTCRFRLLNDSASITSSGTRMPVAVLPSSWRVAVNSMVVLSHDADAYRKQRPAREAILIAPEGVSLPGCRRWRDPDRVERGLPTWTGCKL